MHSSEKGMLTKTVAVLFFFLFCLFILNVQENFLSMECMRTLYFEEWVHICHANWQEFTKWTIFKELNFTVKVN